MPPQRDREILKGIKVSGPRIYPVRKGEAISDLLKARGIKFEEAAKLNPKLDLTKLKGGETILLPNGKYTQREKELLEFAVGMPASSVGIPQFGFSAPTTAQLQLGFAIAFVAAGYGFYVTVCKRSASPVARRQRCCTPAGLLRADAAPRGRRKQRSGLRRTDVEAGLAQSRL